MPYRFLENIATADVAFEAWGKSREEMFVAAADALLNVMVDDPATIALREELDFKLENDELDMLLFNFLNELIFYKDARLLLLRTTSITIDLSTHYTLRVTAAGEQIAPERHPLLVDVKAVTLHRFSVRETAEGWRAEVVLDI